MTYLLMCSTCLLVSQLLFTFCPVKKITLYITDMNWPDTPSPLTPMISTSGQCGNGGRGGKLRDARVWCLAVRRPRPSSRCWAVSGGRGGGSAGLTGPKCPEAACVCVSVCVVGRQWCVPWWSHEAWRGWRWWLRCSAWFSGMSEVSSRGGGSDLHFVTLWPRDCVTWRNNGLLFLCSGQWSEMWRPKLFATVFCSCGLIEAVSRSSWDGTSLLIERILLIQCSGRTPRQVANGICWRWYDGAGGSRGCLGPCPPKKINRCNFLTVLGDFFTLMCAATSFRSGQKGGFWHIWCSKYQNVIRTSKI